MARKKKTFVDQLLETPNGRQTVDELRCANMVRVEDLDKVFHPEKPRYGLPDISTAQSVCEPCKVASDCMLFGWDNRESGVWGGVLLKQGVVQEVKRSNSNRFAA